jgi:hypothetical protein
MRHALFLLLCFLNLHALKAYHIDIKVPESVLANTTASLALEDFRKLLMQAGAPEVSINSEGGDVLIYLPEIPEQEPMTISERPYPTFPVPVRDYAWKAEITDEHYVLKLSAPGGHALSAGLYGLLQDILGFSFLHPRETRLPDLNIWPVPLAFEYQSEPRFNKMGFHLHTQHPLELTQALLDESFPGGAERVREYIDWLARNRQNYFEFCLLETINRKTWPAYAAKWVQYAEDRGIIPGLDLSLHMKQQVAYKLYRNPHRSFRSKENQIKKRIDELTVAGWKVFNMEFSQTEFSAGNAKRKAELRSFIQEILDKKGIHLTGREHVVKPETMVDKAVDKQNVLQEERDNRRGTMIHTVMFYTLNDSIAPVYGNENLHHMRDMLLEALQHRETWYYPESAYWITFDISVPMLLTPYLQARLEDILYCDSLGVEGHLTFSSGWEWGYWLIDWSIANWSWKSTINKKARQPFPEEMLWKLFGRSEETAFLMGAIELQQKEIKDAQLIQFLTAATVTDELPGKFKLPLHPMPKWSYAYLRNDATAEFADSVLQKVIPRLENLAVQYQKLKDEFYNPYHKDPLLQELVDGLDITMLRAQHRAATMRYLAKHRLASLANDPSGEKDALKQLEKAAEIRTAAMKIVRQREAGYRYPVKELTSKYPERTAYHFGYLYTVHHLHFWKRDEEQARQNKWHPLFMNIWPMLRIIGVTEN